MFFVKLIQSKVDNVDEDLHKFQRNKVDDMIGRNGECIHQTQHLSTFTCEWKRNLFQKRKSIRYYKTKG